MKILILCTGNSCRSQMAQGVLQSFDKMLKVYSAGTEIAKEVNPLAIKAMAEIGIDISSHKPRSVNEYLNEEWDYVITVCGGVKEACPMFSGKVLNRVHLGFDDPSKAEGTTEFIWSEFIRVRNEIKEKFWKLYIERIEPQQGVEF